MHDEDAVSTWPPNEGFHVHAHVCDPMACASRQIVAKEKTRRAIGHMANWPRYAGPVEFVFHREEIARL